MKNKVLVFLIIIIFCFGFLAASEVKAGAEHNVWGWAWSENLGWISFNSLDIGGPVSYGVDIDSATGLFSGYAWSRGTTANPGGIGWIKFDPGGSYPDTPNYSVCLDLPGAGQSCDGAGDYTVSGWARAYRAIAPLGQTLGGWDGWIRLRGTWTDGVWLNTSSGPPYEFHNWAWGGDDSVKEAVIGWISFNCAERGICGTSDYKVMTDLAIAPVNNSPTASPLPETQSYACKQSAGDPLSPNPSIRVKFQWTYSDDDGDPQDSYRLQVYDNSGYTPPEVYNSGQSTSPPLTEQEIASPIINFDTSYWWQVTVWDDQGGSSDPADARGNFTIMESPPYPKFECAEAVDSGQQSCDSISPDALEDVSFVNLTELCDTGCNYQWDFDNDAIIDSTEQSPIYAYPIDGDYTAVLIASDNDGTCVTTHTITVGIGEEALPLPKWKEIPPF